MQTETGIILRYFVEANHGNNMTTPLKIKLKKRRRRRKKKKKKKKKKYK